jgi:hypothetical protein
MTLEPITVFDATMNVLILAFGFVTITLSLRGVERNHRPFATSFLLVNFLTIFSGFLTVFLSLKYYPWFSMSSYLKETSIILVALIFLLWTMVSNQAGQKYFTIASAIVLVVWIVLFRNLFSPLFHRDMFIGISNLTPLEMLFVLSRAVLILACLIVVIASISKLKRPVESRLTARVSHQHHKKCSHCGELSDFDADFCMHCGKPLASMKGST